MLGIDGLPALRRGLAPKTRYGMAFDQQAMRMMVGACTLATALRAGQPCIWLSPLDPAMLVKKAALAGVDLGPYLSLIHI